MKVTQIEGEPAEIAAYMQLIGNDGGIKSPDDGDDEASDEITASGEGQVGGAVDAHDLAWLKRFVWSRGRDSIQTQLVEDYLTRVLNTEDVLVEAGTSTRTANGESNYLMVRDDGPRRFGAVTYVSPRSAKLNFRLLERHVEDVRDRVTVRNIVRGQHHYRITLELANDQDVELALDLTKRALAEVRN